jgi:hypothetical protein
MLTADFLHKFVELLTCIDSLVFIDTAVLSEGGEVIVIEDPGYNALGDDTVPPVVNNGGCEHVQPLAV